MLDAGCRNSGLSLRGQDFCRPLVDTEGQLIQQFLPVALRNTLRDSPFSSLLYSKASPILLFVMV